MNRRCGHRTRRRWWPAVVGIVALSPVGGWAEADVAAAGALRQVTISATNLSFPATYVGATTELQVVLTNTGTAAVTPALAGGAPVDSTNFGVSQNCGGVSLAPGATCAFTYRFRPQTPGTKSSSTSITVDGVSHAISMSGEGLYPFSVAPTTLSFPDTAVGSTATIQTVVTNVSPVPQTVSMSGGAPIDPTHFGASQNCAGVTLQGGASCQVTYTYTPTAPGAHSTTTTLGVNGTNFSLQLAGTSGGAGATTTTTTTTTDPGQTTTTDPGQTTTTDPGPTTTSAPSPTTTAPPSTTPGLIDSSVLAVPAPVVSGNGVVIARGIVEFPAGTFEWGYERFGDDGGVIVVAGWQLFSEGIGPTALISLGEPALLVSDAAGRSLALLDRFEAVFVPAGTPSVIQPLVTSAGGARGARIVFPLGSGANAFDPGAGSRDFNLIAAVLEPGESVRVESGFPVLVIVAEGAVSDQLTGITYAEGGHGVTGASVELVNDTEVPAHVLLGAVGGQVP